MSVRTALALIDEILTVAAPNVIPNLPACCQGFVTQKDAARLEWKFARMKVTLDSNIWAKLTDLASEATKHKIGTKVS
jgi:hypothetical protein